MSQITTKAVVWDLDGTLIDSFHLFIDICHEVFPNHGLTVPSEAVFRTNYHGRLEDTFRGILPDLDDAQITQIAADFMVIDNLRYANLDGHLYPDALDLAQRIHAKGIMQIAVSNRGSKGGDAAPRSIIVKPPLQGLFETAVSGDDNAFFKPDARVLDAVMQQYDLQPTDFTVVGDQFVDARLAMNLGTNAVLVNRHFDDIPHLEQLGSEWEQHVSIVESLSSVAV